MLTNPDISLSKEQLFLWLKNVGKQYSTGVVIIDMNKANLPIVYYNGHFANLCGYKQQQLIGKSLAVLNGIKTNSEIATELNYHLQLAMANQFTILHYAQDGTAFWNNIMIHPFQDTEGKVQYLLLTCEDYTDPMLYKMLSKLEREVYIELERDDDLESILNVITEQVENYYIRDVYCAIHLIQQDGTTKVMATGSLPTSLVTNLPTIDLGPQVGYSGKAVYLKDIDIGDNWQNDSHGSTLQICSSWIKPILNQQQEGLGALTLYFNEYTELKQTDIDFLTRLTSLITLSIKYAEQKQQLTRLAYYDLETNIPNLHYFHNIVAEWINTGYEGFISIIQPSEYSRIVDLYGRKAGDEILRQMVDRITNLVMGDEEFIARFSNSSIIIATKGNLAQFNTYDSRIQQLTISPYSIGSEEIYITLKVGISHFIKTQLIEDCIRHADLALTKSRSKSGTNVSFFEEYSDIQAQQEMNILNQLSYALQHNEFTVYLQPKINFKTLQLEGFEALSRWYSHVLGPVSPVVFIPVAERAGKIKEIDTLAIKKVLSWQQQRLVAKLTIVPIAINISPDHFYDQTFMIDFFALLRTYNVPSKYVKLEVTESIELVDFAKAKDILLTLQKAGIDSSIDDFGVGFSSLSYLPQLPFSEIKIDRSFINAMDDSGMHAVVQTIVQLAANLQMRAVAEGVETIEQFNMLQAMGCHTGQGYYFYKPMSLDDATELLNPF